MTSMLDTLFLDPLRIALALALLIAPAWYLLRSLPDDALPPGLRVVSKAVLGVALLIVAGVVLDAGTTLTAWHWALALVLVVGGALAWRRWSAARSGDGLPLAPALGGGPASALPSVRRADLGLLLAALGITLGAVALARAGAHEAMQAPATELWVARTESGVTQVNVRNLEGQAMDYRVEVRAGSRVLDSWQVSSLDNGEQAVHDVAPLADKSPVQAIRVELFRADDAAPYRHLVIAR
jgi:hypothetical protein